MGRRDEVCSVYEEVYAMCVGVCECEIDKISSGMCHIRTCYITGVAN